MQVNHDKLQATREPLGLHVHHLTDDSNSVLQDTFVFLTWGWLSKCLMESSLEAEWGQ